MKKEYFKPILEIEIINLSDQILASGITKDDSNHSYGSGSDLVL